MCKQKLPACLRTYPPTSIDFPRMLRTRAPGWLSNENENQNENDSPTDKTVCLQIASCSCPERVWANDHVSAMMIMISETQTLFRT
jgi:hypothetical protein